MKTPLGFGMMRLPQKSDDPADIDYEKLYQMVDAFMAAGYRYFDTSYVYHNGASEIATRKAVVERYPRDRYEIATKFPIFTIQSEDEIEPIFQNHLKNLGVEYIDYYLIHNVQTYLYDGIDGNGGIIKATNLFEHAKRWKKEGRIKHLGFSFHSSADVLERVLKEHPEVEFVQLAINYLDWESEFVQAKACYETALRYGKQVIVMEPVKGGALVRLPERAEKILKDFAPDQSVVTWAQRFAASLDGVLVHLSGMSDLEQVKQNIRIFGEMESLNETEKNVLKEAVATYRDIASPSQEEIEKFRGIAFHGVPATAILQAYAIMKMVPNPAGADETVYLKNSLAEYAHMDIHGDFPKENIILPDGTNGTSLLEEAFEYLVKFNIF